VGIYAKSSNFKPIFHEGSRSITLNGPPISRQISYAAPIGAWGICGGTMGGSFYEGYALSHADGFGSFLLGWNLPNSAWPNSDCGLLTNQCEKAGSATLSMKLLNCIIDSKEGRLVQTTLRPSVVILVDPDSPILPEMWNAEPI
jgi:hypothetical protein